MSDTKAELIQKKISKLIDDLKELKPNDRSDLDRKIAICITDAEKMEAYFCWQVAPFVVE